ncbi:MAG: 5-(carboxyamino)imidazole ribonucleotide synthase [Mariniphaga sp.]
MNSSFFNNKKVLGIIGGGQLGKMLLQSANTWNIFTRVLASDKESSPLLYCNEIEFGDLQEFEAVYNFGKGCDIITIEIEHVNIDALLRLKKEGVIVHPDPDALQIIKDKGLQKQFLKNNGFPTSDFRLFENKNEILKALKDEVLQFPFVQKSRKDGYDGRGVKVIQSISDLNCLMNIASLVESKVSIKNEISIIASRNSQGEIACYDAVQMNFVKGANMLDILSYPANIGNPLANKAKALASSLIEKMSICGLLVVEFFVDKNNNLLINEVAPRPHNSGHQTIESSDTSQFEQHMRGVLNLPLGSTAIKIPSVMINLLGEEGHSGNVCYENIEKCLAIEGVHIHIYGKNQTKPFRKMGHVTVTNSSLKEAKKTAKWIKKTLKVTSR